MCNDETGADVLGACARFLTIISQKHHRVGELKHRSDSGLGERVRDRSVSGENPFFDILQYGHLKVQVSMKLESCHHQQPLRISPEVLERPLRPPPPRLIMPETSDSFFSFLSFISLSVHLYQYTPAEGNVLALPTPPPLPPYISLHFPLLLLEGPASIIHYPLQR